MTTRPTTDGDTPVAHMRYYSVSSPGSHMHYDGEDHPCARCNTRDTRISEQEVELERYRREMEANGQLYDEQLAMFRTENERYHSALKVVQTYFEAGGYATLDGATLGVIGVVNHAFRPTTQDPMRED